MPKHAQSARRARLMAHARTIAARPTSFTERQAANLPEIDPFEIARDRQLRQGRTDWRSERSPSAFAVMAPPKPKGSEPKRMRQDRWGEIVGKHDESAQRPMGTRSSEIKPPIVRSYTGAKASNPEASDRQANRMRDGITKLAGKSDI